MPTSLTAFSNGAVVSASDIRDRHDEVQDYLNGGVIATDLRTNTKWVDPSMIDPPRFFVGARASRAIMPTADVYWTRTSQGVLGSYITADDIKADAWTPIEGLSRTIYVNPPRYGSTADLFVHYTLYARDLDGQLTDGGGARETTEAAEFRLFMDDTGYGVTTRRIFAGTDADHPFSRKHHTVSKVISGVSAGERKLEVRVYVNDNSAVTVRDWNKIMSRSRFLRVRVQYL